MGKKLHVNSKTILIMTDYAAPYPGNLIRSLIGFEKQMILNGINIIWSFPKRAENIDWMKEFSERTNGRVVDFFPEGMTEIYNHLNRMNRKQKFDIIYTHMCRHKTQVAIWMFYKSIYHGKLVSHFHNHCKIPNNLIKRAIYILAYQMYKGDINIGCSESVKDSMPYSSKIKKVAIENAIDFKRLDVYEKYKLQKSSENACIILMFGFDYYRKGVDIAISAIKKIANDKNIILAISLAGNYEKVKQKIISDFGEIPEFVRLLQPRDDVATYYQMANIFLSAAREEGFCYSVVESIYCNTVCISSNIGGVPWNIPGVYTFKSENADNLKEVIMDICSRDKKELETNVTEGKEYVLQNYSLSKWVEKEVSQFKLLLK